MNYENIFINLLALYIVYKAVTGSLAGLKYIFFICIGLHVYFKGLKRGGFFYRQLIQNENETDIYLIRPLKEFF